LRIASWGIPGVTKGGEAVKHFERSCADGLDIPVSRANRRGTYVGITDDTGWRYCRGEARIPQCSKGKNSIYQTLSERPVITNIHWNNMGTWNSAGTVRSPWIAELSTQVPRRTDSLNHFPCPFKSSVAAFNRVRCLSKTGTREFSPAGGCVLQRCPLVAAFFSLTIPKPAARPLLFCLAGPCPRTWHIPQERGFFVPTVGGAQSADITMQ
jgi:hypothetical protein